MELIGQGTYGYVISNIGKREKVNKLICIDNLTKREYHETIEEYRIGQILDNYNCKYIKFFLPVLKMEMINVMTNKNKKISKALNKCNFKTKKRIVNFTLEKGGNFKKIIINLTDLELLRCMTYLILGIKACSEDLNIGLLDIKVDNIMFSKNKNNIFPVFIDFSSCYVISTRESFYSFIYDFGIWDLHHYPPWSRELQLLLVNTYREYHNEKILAIEGRYVKREYAKKIKLNIKKFNNFLKDSIADDEKIDLENEVLNKKIIKLFDSKNGYKFILQQSMIYSIGIIFHKIFKRRRSKFYKITRQMINYDLNKRIIPDKLLHIISNYIIIKPKDLVINISSHDNKKNIMKIFDNKKFSFKSKLFTSL